MKNTRAKNKKTQDSLKISFSQRVPLSESDNDESTQSGALIGSNDDLLNVILGRLPANSILRFKSVSKQWLSILTHPRFTLFFDKLLKPSGLFVRKLYVPFDVENQSPPPFRKLDFYPDPFGIKIVQSCNGLLLCCSKKGPENYYVFNPTTKQFAVIPSVGKLISFMGLAYHPTDCVHFKLICVHYPYNGPDPEELLFEILIYSSHIGTWKFILDQSSWKFRFSTWDTYFSYGVYWNRAFHFAPSELHSVYFMLDEEKLLSLPTTVEGMQIEDYEGGGTPTYFGESRGHLHLVATIDYENPNPFRLNVYEMLSDHSGWFVKYQVDLDELSAAYPEMIRNNPYSWSLNCYGYKIIDVIIGEKEEDTFIVLSFSGKLIRYNILDKSFVEIFIMNKFYPDGRPKPLNVHRYTEALTSF